MTYADSTPVLGRSRNEAPELPAVDVAYCPSASMRPPARQHLMTIRVYDVCIEHGAHTDPDLLLLEVGS